MVPLVTLVGGTLRNGSLTTGIGCLTEKKLNCVLCRYVFSVCILLLKTVQYQKHRKLYRKTNLKIKKYCQC